jgi:hypothetical protein
MDNVAVVTGIVSIIAFTYFHIYKYNMETKDLTPAEKHYLAMKKAQKKYYEKKMDEKGPRRGKGRPRKEKECWVISNKPME